MNSLEGQRRELSVDQMNAFKTKYQMIKDCLNPYERNMFYNLERTYVLYEGLNTDSLLNESAAKSDSIVKALIEVRKTLDYQLEEHNTSNGYDLLEECYQNLFNDYQTFVFLQKANDSVSEAIDIQALLEKIQRKLVVLQACLGLPIMFIEALRQVYYALLLDVANGQYEQEQSPKSLKIVFGK